MGAPGWAVTQEVPVDKEHERAGGGGRHLYFSPGRDIGAEGYRAVHHVVGANLPYGAGGQKAVIIGLHDHILLFIAGRKQISVAGVLQMAHMPFSKMTTRRPSSHRAVTVRSAVPIMKSTWIMESFSPISCISSRVRVS